MNVSVSVETLARGALRFDPSARMRQVVSFGAIGAISTLAYATFAFLLTMSDAMPAWTASGVAYAVTSVFSYLCHKRLTFRSSVSHGEAVPRFLLSNSIGYTIALLLPMLLSDHLRAPPALAIFLTIVIVPILNFLLLDRFVFRPRTHRRTRAA
jgi:putative flippase GtrA